MGFAPQQDWDTYEVRAKQSDTKWLRQLTPGECFDLYEDLYNVVTQANCDRGDEENLEQNRWRAKLALRKKLVTAFQKLDELRCGQTSSNDTC